MVDVASSSPVSVGLIAWPHHEGAATVVVKAAFDVRADGSIALAPRSTPLSLDARAPDGALLYPSDFAPHKPAADVVVVGEEGRASEAVASLSIGARGTTARHVGPIDAHDPADAGWSRLDFDFARFQSARPEQRAPKLVCPLLLSFARGPLACSALVDLPTPSLVVTRAGAKLPVAVTCDTLLLDPRARILVALFRGYAEPAFGWGEDTRILCSFHGALEVLADSETTTWPRHHATRFEHMVPGGAAPSEDDSDESDDDVDELSSTVQRGSSPAPIGLETVALRASPVAAALPFVPGRFSPTRSARDTSEEDGDPLSNAPVGGATVPLGAESPVAYLASRANAARTAPVPQLTREQVDRIARELDAAPHARRDILSRYGLSEGIWNVVVQNARAR